MSFQNITSHTKLHQLHANIILDKKSINANSIDNIIKQYYNKVLPGRVIIRESNTEPILRITVEHENKDLAQQFINDIQQTIMKQLQ